VTGLGRELAELAQDMYGAATEAADWAPSGSGTRTFAAGRANLAHRLWDSATEQRAGLDITEWFER
jgi:hypothetical protein